MITYKLFQGVKTPSAKVYKPPIVIKIRKEIMNNVKWIIKSLANQNYHLKMLLDKVVTPIESAEVI